MQKTNSVNENLPSISIIIPTYNSEETLVQCLESIAIQDYPKEKIEVIIVEGGSKDKIAEIVRKHKVDKVLYNPLQVEEFGRVLGINASKNELIAFIDQDNILISSDWLKKMVEPFKENEIVASEPLFYAHRREDSPIIRYCGLIGADDPFYVYLGYYDRFCYFKGKWTEAPIEAYDKGDYLHIRLLSDREIPTMGANGFMIRRQILSKIRYKPFVHTDVIQRLVEIGFKDFAKVKVEILHLHADNLSGFVKKKYRRFCRHFTRKTDYNAIDFRQKVPGYLLYTFLIFPVARDTINGYKRMPDSAWLLHLLLGPLMLLTYAFASIKLGLQN